MSYVVSCARAFALAGILLSATAISALAQTTPTPAAAAPAAKIVPLKDGAFRRNGKVFRLQAGQASPLSAPMRFSNGLTLRPDGILISKSGTRQLLGNGKAVNMQGDVVIYRDDMMSPQAIERYDEQTTGAKPTVVEIPAAVNMAALNTELQRTAQRLEQLRQLSNLLAERTTAASTSAPSTVTEQQIKELSQQLAP
ncbi:DUF6799 domain-containing protein [Hymenobacter tenuis]